MPNKREEIIRAAADVIHTKGYQAASLNDFMEAAGIGKGQFYHYFTSKRDLGLGVVDFLKETWEQELLQKILRSDQDPGYRLEAMLDWMIGIHRGARGLHGCPFGNLALEMSEHDEAFRQRIHGIFRDWTVALRDTLEELQKRENRFPGADAEQLAVAVVAAIEGGILLMKSCRDPQPLEDVIHVLRQQWLK